MNTENGWRVPAPNPDNASAWRTVLMHYLHRVTVMGDITHAWICPAIDECRVSRRIPAAEAAALEAELDGFLLVPSGCREGFLPIAAYRHGAWPSDLSRGIGSDRDSRVEFRLRFLRWRAGLDPQGELPWARMTGEPE